MLADIGRDPDAFEEFYRAHLAWVRRFVARRVEDPHTAADLTADIFLAVIDSAPGYDASAGTATAWLAGIARNVVAGHVRRRVRESRANGRLSGRALLDEQSAERIADRIDGERTARELYRALAGLPEGGGDLLRVTLPPGAVRDGETFVLSLAHRTVPGTEGDMDFATNEASVSFGVAAGPVAPCKPQAPPTS